MDIIFIIGLIFISVLTFWIASREYNPFMYLSVFIFGLLGFVLIISSPVYYVVQEVEQVTCTNCTYSDVIMVVPVQYPIPTALNIAFILYFLLMAIGCIFLWIDNKETL